MSPVFASFVRGIQLLHHLERQVLLHALDHGAEVLPRLVDGLLAGDEQLGFPVSGRL